MEENDQPKIIEAENDKPVAIKKKTLFITAIVIVVLFGALLIWKTIQVNSLKKDHAKQQEELKTQYKTLHTQLNTTFLKQLAKPGVWAIRTEMMQNNMGQVNQYVNDLVKERNFISVMVANDKGIIVATTDKKFEGKNFLSFNSAYYINVDSTMVNKVNDSLLIMTSPIMSFNSKLGTLIINYAVTTPPILR